ncbi:MAG: alpha-ketoglutarate-dependent dioxygenase AlkB [Actinomycetes bacterium]
MGQQVTWQPSLLDDGEVRFDASYDGLRRIPLDAESWVDYCPAWLHGADAVMAELLASADWHQRSRRMYDNRVLEPRLTAGWSTDDVGDAVPAVVRDMAASLSDRYAVAFDAIWMNLYRDGADSVAWHGDRNRFAMERPLVATVSLGARRRFLLRRRGTSKIVHELDPGGGDLIVMGGRCQHDWEHHVPKTAKVVGARISITIRHSRPGATSAD